MYTVSIEDLNNTNILNNKLLLHPSENYIVTSITGLAPPPSNVVGTAIPATDGQTLNSHRINERDIVLTIYINNPVGTNRVALYKFLSTKRHVQLMIDSGAREAVISGYVESFECDLFSSRQYAQVSIKCLEPYFEDINSTQTELADTEKKFQFAFKIPDPPQTVFSERTSLTDAQFTCLGDVPTGCEIELSFEGDYSGIVMITDTMRNRSMRLKYDFKEDDVLKINTNPGRKSIRLVRDGKTTNLISSLIENSTWITVYRGINGIAVTTPDNSSAISLISGYMAFYNKYMGV